MTNENAEKIFSNLKIKKDIWKNFCEIDSIIMKNGVGYYPNWKHLRFLYTGKEILIKHGDSLPYGARLTTSYGLSEDRLEVSFTPGQIVIPSEYYSDFRLPRFGDIIRSSETAFKVLSESIIMDVKFYANTTQIKLATPIFFSNYSKLSFYDPNEYKKETAMHATEVEGIYMNFKERKGKSYKNFGSYHEKIKIKDISEINLKLSNKKVYKLD